MVKILTLLSYYDNFLPIAMTFPNIKGLGHKIQDRSFLRIPEWLKKRLNSKLIHANLCLIKPH